MVHATRDLQILPYRVCGGRNAGGLWEALGHAIKKFEVAITLNNITDPTMQAKLLYLATVIEK